MTRSVGNCVHRGAGPNGKSPTPRAPPPAARGEGRPRPLSEGPVSPRPARGPGAAGRRRPREGRPGVRGAGGLLRITSCRRRRISGISPTLLRPPKTNAPTHTHSHTLGPGSVTLLEAMRWQSLCWALFISKSLPSHRPGQPL